MSYKLSDQLEEEITLIQRELDDEDIQFQKFETMSSEEYESYRADLEDRIGRLQEQYEQAIAEGH